jgi:hypothetical protein
MWLFVECRCQITVVRDNDREAVDGFFRRDELEGKRRLGRKDVTLTPRETAIICRGPHSVVVLNVWAPELAALKHERSSAGETCCEPRALSRGRLWHPRKPSSKATPDIRQKPSRRAESLTTIDALRH